MDDVSEDTIEKKLSFREKWILAVLIGVVAMIAFSPLSFVLSNRVGCMIGIKTLKKEGPTGLGFTLHVVFFILVFRLLMK